MTGRRQVLVGGLIALWGGPVSLLVGCDTLAEARWNVVAGDRIEADLQRVGAVLAKLAYVPAQDSLRVGSPATFWHPTQYYISVSVMASAGSKQIEVVFFEQAQMQLSRLADRHVTVLDAELAKEFGRERILLVVRASGR